MQNPKTLSDEAVRLTTAIPGLPVAACFIETVPIEGGPSLVHLCLTGEIEIDGVTLEPGIDGGTSDVPCRIRRIPIHAALMRDQTVGEGMDDIRALSATRAVLDEDPDALAWVMEWCVDCPACVRAIMPVLERLVRIAPEAAQCGSERMAAAV